jgi:glycosyltransferase involved in cell wall biosynthesis
MKTNISHVLIVTPTRNSEAYLNETILSIFTQEGDCEIFYHVQDCESSDATLDIIKYWEQMALKKPAFLGRAKIHFSWSSERDASMYDGINKGFEKLFEKMQGVAPENILMTWINSDDKFATGAIQTVSSFLNDSEKSEWVTGLPCLILSDGTIVDVRDSPCAFARNYLRQGRYDGRTLPFLQQEGTFWRASLWQKTGGLNAQLRLAGDWDLWRRFAEFNELITMRAVLGFHRRLQGQLSEDRDGYYREIDRIIDEQKSAFQALNLSLLSTGSIYSTAPLTGWRTENGWFTYWISVPASMRLSLIRRLFYKILTTIKFLYVRSYFYLGTGKAWLLNKLK